MKRRKFLKLCAFFSGSVILGSYMLSGISKFSSLVKAQVTPTRTTNFGMVIDTRACIGCRRCAYGCVEENNIGRNSGFQWITVIAMKHGSININEDAEIDYADAPNPDRWYLPIQCMHCENPPCTQVCPVGATWKSEDGIVVIDYNRCIGCRYCMAACPYWARHFNIKRPNVPVDEINPEGGIYSDTTYKNPIRPMGVVEKCTFCAHRVRKGIEPKCVEVCPVGARHFGDINNPDSVVSKLMRSRRVFQLKEELNTQPQIYYVG